MATHPSTHTWTRWGHVLWSLLLSMGLLSSQTLGHLSNDTLRSFSYKSLRPSSYKTLRHMSYKTLRLSSYETFRPSSYETLRPSSYETLRPSSYKTMRPSSYARSFGYCFLPLRFSPLWRSPGTTKYESKDQTFWVAKKREKSISERLPSCPLCMKTQSVSTDCNEWPFVTSLIQQVF